jgi:ribosomal protein L4
VQLLLEKGANREAVTGRPRVEWRYESNFRTGEVKHPPKTALQLAQARKPGAETDALLRLLTPARTAGL